MPFATMIFTAERPGLNEWFGVPISTSDVRAILNEEETPGFRRTRRDCFIIHGGNKFPTEEYANLDDELVIMRPDLPSTWYLPIPAARLELTPEEGGPLGIRWGTPKEELWVSDPLNAIRERLFYGLLFGPQGTLRWAFRQLCLLDPELASEALRDGVAFWGESGSKRSIAHLLLPDDLETLLLSKDRAIREVAIASVGLATRPSAGIPKAD